MISVTEIPPDKLDVKLLAEIIDPFRTLTDLCVNSNGEPLCRSTDGISHMLINQHVQNDNLKPEVYTNESAKLDAKEWTPSDHAARIAWLVEFGWSDPIELDFGIPSLGHCWYPLLDGHHRLAAAIFRHDNWIMANCSGDVEEIERYRWRDHDADSQRDQSSWGATP